MLLQTSIILRLLSAILGLAALTGNQSLAESSLDGLKLNEIQVIGTHNSYHLEPSKPVMALIKTVNAEAAESIAYSHKPMTEQLERLGIRQLEWDLYADPKGGLFADSKKVSALMAKRRFQQELQRISKIREQQKNDFYLTKKLLDEKHHYTEKMKAYNAKFNSAYILH